VKLKTEAQLVRILTERGFVVDALPGFRVVAITVAGNRPTCGTCGMSNMERVLAFSGTRSVPHFSLMSGTQYVCLDMAACETRRDEMVARAARHRENVLSEVLDAVCVSDLMLEKIECGEKGPG